ncbi:mechanosensitive ion channel family protein [Babesia caballi]|uniref:Mechanosensitive ion channel family protein n=1 Tax=Babesia caballi TaxID=5871 RepID=A0AAV4LX96_BABCB|nr:mechanosensitive ion channel family protein [Babesia caballi]
MDVERGLTSKGSDVLVYVRTSSTESKKEGNDSQETNATDRTNSHKSSPPTDYEDIDDGLFESGWWRSVQCLLHEFVHDNTALWIFAVHLLVFFICLCFGPLILPLQEASGGDQDLAQLGYLPKGKIEAVDCLRDGVSHLKSIRNGMCFTLGTLLLSTCTLLVVMSVRYLVIKLLVQPLFNISRLAVVVTYAIDPAAAYCLWTIINYGLFHRYTLPVLDGSTLVAYDLEIFGKRFSQYFEIDLRYYAWANSAFQLQILIALRRLVLSSLLFLFEVSFLPNYSQELRTFLNDQALLRKFNIAWLNFVNAARESDHHAVIEKVELARNAISKLPMPETPIVHGAHVYYDTSHFTIFRPPIHPLWFRQASTYNMRRKVDEVPQFTRELWIKQCATNVLVNWSALHYVVHHPPELLFMDYYVPLVSKKTVQEYSQLLFDHMYETMTALSDSSVSGIVSTETRRLSSMKRESTSAPPGRATLEVPMNRMVKRSAVPFSRGPAVSRSKTVLHMGHVLSAAAESDSGDEGASDCCSDPQLRRRTTAMEERRSLTPKLFSALNPAVVEAFFAAHDIGSCGYVSSNVFTRNVLYMCSIRKRLISALKNQRSILGLVNRLLSTALWFLIFVVYLMTFRVNKNIVLPSVIGFFSAMIVALSYMYTSFITAIIFVVLSNPYNVGDRIRIEDGEAMYVNSITTYNTEFRCVHDKLVTYQNSVLSTRKIINETRARHAAHEIVVRVGANTTPAALKQLAENVKSYLNGRPRDFVRDSCFVYGSDIQVGHYYVLKFLVTYMDTWTSPVHVNMLRNDVIVQLAKQCNLLGITYKEPIMPVHFSGDISYCERAAAPLPVPEPASKPHKP